MQFFSKENVGNDPPWGRSINSDQFVNSFIMAIYEEKVLVVLWIQNSNDTKKFSHEHYEIIYEPIRIDRSSDRVRPEFGNANIRFKFAWK